MSWATSSRTARLKRRRLQLHLDCFEQVVGLLFLQRQVGVPADPERRPFLDHHADEQPIETRCDQLLDGQEATRCDVHEPRKHVGHLEPCESTLARFGIDDADGQRQGEVGDVGKGVAGVDGERGEHGKHPLLEELLEHGAFVVGGVGIGDDVDAGGAQSGHEPVEEGRIEPLDQAGNPVADRRELLGRCAPVERWTVDAGDDLILQRGDSHLEELVEVRRSDRAELGPLEQRDARFAGELEHTLVERDPAQLPTEKTLVDHGWNTGSRTIRSRRPYGRGPIRS